MSVKQRQNFSFKELPTSVQQALKRCIVFNGATVGSSNTNLVALFEDGHEIASRYFSGRGGAEKFAPLSKELLEKAHWAESDFTSPIAVIAIIGPGSFTGLRASLSLGAGLAYGWGGAVIGVQLGDAMRLMAEDEDVTIFSFARKGRVFIESPREAMPYGAFIEDISPIFSKITGDAVVGDTCIDLLLSRLTQKKDVTIFPYSAPDSRAIFKAGCQAFLKGKQHPFLPLYIDPPLAKAPKGGLRPFPIK